MGKKQLRQQILDCVDDDIQKIAQSISRDLEKYSLTVIQRFYLDYDPQIYKRQYALPFVLNSGKIKKVDDGYYKVTMKYTYDDLFLHHGQNDWDVFNGPFVQGYHGGPIRRASGWNNVKSSKGNYYKKASGYIVSPAPQTIPSPWKEILTYAKYRYNAKEVKE